MVKRVLSLSNYYEVLEVTKEANDVDIKKSYRKVGTRSTFFPVCPNHCTQLALQLHPDKNGAPGADEAFKRVNDAFNTLSDVSKRMMVSNGNVTGLVERLVESGHLDRRTSDSDRRVQVIRLTKIGRAEFRKMAEEHQLWISDIFGDLAPKDVRELMRLLAKTKTSAQKATSQRAV